MSYKSSRAKKLGITKEQYAALLAAQDGHCALCPNVPKTRSLHVDHEHKTGQVRGLLCFRCNRFLPSWVTAGWAMRLLDYLPGHGMNPQARRVLDEINAGRGDSSA